MSGPMRIGQIILGRYEVVTFVGTGGEGDVAEGVDLQTGAAVAIKQLAAHPDDARYAERLARFQRSAKIRIGHPGVVDVQSYGEEDGECYLIMPFVEGVDLEVYRLRSGGRCSFQQTQFIIADIAAGLSAIHARGIVHRDLKPLNVLVDTEGRTKILDFGICRVSHQATISAGVIIGTPAWMAPEQTDPTARVDHRCDLFSLGLLTLYLATGKEPVQANDTQTARRIICEQRFPLLRELDPSVPDYFSAACARLLAKRPEDRFASADEFLTAVNGAGSPATCASCGIGVDNGAKFCATCGASLHAVRTTARCLACGTAAGQAAVCPGCQRPFSAHDHRFCFDAGPAAGTTFRVVEGIYDVGREVIAPRDCRVSRRHLLVACVNGTVAVQDAGSANNTYIDGQPADRLIELRSGMQLLVVGNRAVFHSN